MFPIFQRTVTNSSGDVLPGASVEVRRESDNALVQLYADRAGTVLLPNPTTADSDGFVQFFAASSSYRITATSGAGTVVWRYVDIGSADVRNDLSAPTGAAMVGFEWGVLPAALNRIDWGIHTASSGVNVFRYIPPSEWPAIIAGSSTYDATANIQTALNSGHKSVRIIGGKFRVTPQSNTAALTVPDGVSLVGDGTGELFMVTDPADAPNTSVNWDVVLFTGARTNWSYIDGVRIRHSGGARNNCASIAVRSGASMVSITRNDIDGSIGSGIVVEGSVASPYNTSTIVMGNKIANTVRHGVYVSGAANNVVRFNHIKTTRLESIVNRNGSDNDIDENVIDGDGVMYPTHAIAMAQPSSGTYTIDRVRIRGNRMNNIPGAGFYGQGLGVILKDADICNNIVNAMQAGTFHAMMFYRLSDSRVNGNTVHGGRNRGLMFYGCQRNDVTGNRVRNVNSVGAAVGCIQFQEYSDPADTTTTYSTGNTIGENSIVDSRGSPSHVYGINFLAGSNDNKIGVNYINGFTSSRYSAADPWSTFKTASGDERQWYFNDIATGTVAQTQMPVIGDTFSDVASESGWLKSLSIVTRQTLTSGTINVTLYKNGSAFRTVVLTGNGSTTYAALFDEPEKYTVAVGDRLTMFFQTNSVVAGSTVDMLARAKFATA